MPESLAHVVGARPNFMKAAPVVSQLRSSDVRQILIHTGQHYDPALSRIFFEQLAMPEPDFYLGVGSGSHAAQTANSMVALEKAFLDIEPKACVVYGDVNSTIAAALVAKKMGIGLVHIEAGLRSFDRTMPEELNRVLTDTISDLLLTTSPEAYWNLAHEGVEIRKIDFVGNTMIDSLQAGLDLLAKEPIPFDFDLPERFALITLHRPANVDDPKRLQAILSSIAAVSAETPCLFPVHPRGREAIEASGGTEIGGLTLLPPLGYLEFLSMQRDALVVITDSGGVQEETTILGTPCLTVRPNTERPITITMGTNTLVEPWEIPEHIPDSRQSVATRIPPLWDGQAGGRAAESIIRWLT